MWKEVLAAVSSDLTLHVGATQEAIRRAEDALRMPLPDELRELLLETDGVFGSYGLGLVWNIDRVVEENSRFRKNAEFAELYMSFDSLLFFGDAGNGDNFAFPLQAGRARRPDIFVWDHETDSRRWVAPRLDVFFDWWLTGKLMI